LMQGLADGYFVLPYTIGDYLSPDIKMGPIYWFSRVWGGRKELRADWKSWTTMEHILLTISTGN
jgi:hypothetical protein